MKNKDFYKEMDRFKKRKGCFLVQNCCLIIFILVMVFVFFTTGAIAATGLVKIPFFTSIFYREPNPSKVVNPTKIDEGYIIKKLTESSIDGEGRLSILLDSEEISGLINYLFKENNIFEKNQILLTNDKAEIFAKLQKPIQSYITSEFGPDVISDNQLAVEFKKLKLGNLRLPMFIMNPIIDIYLSNGGFNLEFSSEFKITDLKVEGNNAKVTIKLNDKNMNLENLLFDELNKINNGLPFNKQDIEQFKQIYGDKVPTNEELEQFFGGNLPSEEEQEKFKKEIENSKNKY